MWNVQIENADCPRTLNLKTAAECMAAIERLKLTADRNQTRFQVKIAFGSRVLAFTNIGSGRRPAAALPGLLDEFGDLGDAADNEPQGDEWEAQ
jgi:hypothetical protein